MTTNGPSRAPDSNVTGKLRAWRHQYNLRRSLPMRFRLMLAVLCVVAIVGIRAQKASDGDWPMYARDLAGTKFSPLKQITAENGRRLQPAWNVTPVERPAA